MGAIWRINSCTASGVGGVVLIDACKKWLQRCNDDNASDLILTVGASPRLKTAGEIRVIPGARSLSPSDTLEIAVSIIGAENMRQFENDLEWDGSITIEGQRFRINAFWQRGNIGLVFRRLPQLIPTMEQICLPPSAQQFLQSLKGLVLVTGPAGSGKSTTIAAMIDAMNSRIGKHIVTIEEPIEYVFQHKQSLIQQREVGRDTRSFASALRSAMRQHPDVIMIGEMRDLETIAIALTAAETGHLVLGTLHTIDAAQTIDRIVDVFPASQQRQIRVQLAGCLVGIISQMLLPRLGSGYAAAFEVLVSTPAVRALIRECKTHQLRQCMQSGSKDGHIVLEQSLAEMVCSGIVDTRAAESISANPQDFRAYLGNRPSVPSAWGNTNRVV